MTNNFKFITYELTVKNDSSILQNSYNNYRGALRDDEELPPKATYIWPRMGPQTDDTSIFDLTLTDKQIKTMQIVSFQILTNTTTNGVKPEFITLENQSIKPPHTVVGSKGGQLGGVWAALDANSAFQKTYGALAHEVLVPKNYYFRKLTIRLYDADRQPFKLHDELAWAGPGSPKAFQALLTVRLTFY